MYQNPDVLNELAAFKTEIMDLVEQSNSQVSTVAPQNPDVLSYSEFAAFKTEHELVRELLHGTY